MIKLTNSIRQARNQAEIKINRAINKNVKVAKQTVKKMENSVSIDKSEEQEIDQEDLSQKNE